VESFKNTGKIPEGIPPGYDVYANAFHKWMQDNHITIEEQEKTVVSKKYGYAGTCDLVIRKNGTGLWVCDVKTGKDIYLEAHLQLSAYKQALNENGVNVERAGVILLKDTGNYKFEEVDDCFDAFLATKKMWEFLNKEDLEKIGYAAN
jgi:predicted RecB family nuclease